MRRDGEKCGGRTVVVVAECWPLSFFTVVCVKIELDTRRVSSHFVGETRTGAGHLYILRVYAVSRDQGGESRGVCAVSDELTLAMLCQTQQSRAMIS